MGTDIFNIDASWAEKLMKKRVSFLTAPTVFSEGFKNKIHKGGAGANLLHTFFVLVKEKGCFNCILSCFKPL